jgi:hypothetical protein
MDEQAKKELLDMGAYDLDEQTKKELLAAGFALARRGGEPEPRCRWCGGTGKVALLTTEVDCDCVRQD